MNVGGGGAGKFAACVADWAGDGGGCWLGKRAGELTGGAWPDPPPVAALWLGGCAGCPDTLNLIVRPGARTMSSWSAPNVLAPFFASTPITRIGVVFTRIDCPTGESSPNSSRATVAPIRHTPADPDVSWPVKARPSATSQSRTARKSADVPYMQ